MTVKTTTHANRPIPATKFSLSLIFKMALLHNLKMSDASRVAGDFKKQSWSRQRARLNLGGGFWRKFNQIK
jgi:hypothetical protein